MNRRTAVLAVLAFMLGACASTRGVKVGSDNTTSYRIEVHNAHSSAIAVSYTDTRGAHALGDVPAGGTQQFVIAAPSSTSVEIMGTTSGGGHYSQRITLAAGTTTRANL